MITYATYHEFKGYLLDLAQNETVGDKRVKLFSIQVTSILYGSSKRVVFDFFGPLNFPVNVKFSTINSQFPPFN